MNQLFRCVALFVLLTARLAAVRAEGVLDHVPPDAMGFAVVRNLAATNDKLEGVMNLFAGLSEVPPPAPLALIKSATGLGDGLNEAGDALLAVLPGGENAAGPRPLLLLPVSDYAALASSINGDATGAIGRVTIAGEEVLVAKRGDYALLMNVEHRPTMEALLSASPQQPQQLTPLVEWVAANDVALVLLPAGLDLLLEMGRAGNAAEAAQMEQQFADPAFAQMLEQSKAMMRMSERVLEFFGAEVAAGAVGLAIDDATNVRVTKRLILEGDGVLAGAKDLPKLAASPLTAYPAAPFVMAGGGPLPEGWGESLAKLGRAMIEQFPEIYGFDDIDETQWQKLEEAWQAAMQVRSTSMCILAGDKEDPLYSNIYMVGEVADSAAYLEAMRTSMEIWNEMVAKSTSLIKITYELSDVQVAGKPAVLMVADVLAAAGDENVPMVKPIFEAMVGEDGKLRQYVATVDADTVMWSVGTEVSAAKAIEFVRSGGAGLDQAEEVRTTTGLMNPDARWIAYISPPGCVAWFDRAMRGAMGQLGVPGFTIPEYPAGPPVGFSVNLGEGRLDGEMVVPKKTLEDLAAFIKKVQEM